MGTVSCAGTAGNAVHSIAGAFHLFKLAERPRPVSLITVVGKEHGNIDLRRASVTAAPANSVRDADLFPRRTRPEDNRKNVLSHRTEAGTSGCSGEGFEKEGYIEHPRRAGHSSEYKVCKRGRILFRYAIVIPRKTEVFIAQKARINLTKRSIRAYLTNPYCFPRNYFRSTQRAFMETPMNPSFSHRRTYIT